MRWFSRFSTLLTISEDLHLQMRESIKNQHFDKC